MGTPGHMAHPFDVEDIQTGEDLLDYINDAVTKLAAGEIGGSVKWDGINTSIKLITNDNGEKEFRMDRGTSEIASVIGFDADAAFKKWGEQHGMPHAIANVLSIFNNSIPLIKSELKTLGLWDDPTKYFNTEYIEGKSNVQEYDTNILAIHGINQFYEKKAQAWRIRNGTAMDRPGLPRPLDASGKPVKSGGIEIEYNHNALENLIRKVQPAARKLGFKVFGDVPVEFDPEMELDIESVLNIPIEIELSHGNIKRGSLREWLKMVEHPKGKMITKILRDKNGNPTGEKKVGALSKDIYLAVLRSATEDGIPLSEYLKDPKEINDAINGGIFYHATRLLGQAVKNVLTSEAGSLGTHEGVVLRGLEDFLVKLTGDFIVQGLASTHGNHVKENLENDFTIVISKNKSITKSLNEWIVEASEANHKFQKLPEMVYKDILAGTPIVDIVVQENAEKTIYNAVMGYVNGLQEEEDETDDPVVDADFPKTVAIVPGAFKPPHKGHLDMVRAYADNADEVIVLISRPTKSGRKLPNGREITSEDSLRIWNILTSDLTNVTVSVSDHASPINAAYEYVGPDGPLEPGTRVILGASTKGNDASRWSAAEKYIKDGVELLPPDQTAVNPTSRASGEPYSATDFRKALGGALENRAEIADFVGEENVDEVLSILGLETPIEEMSSSGAGAGYAGPLGSTLVNRGPLTPTPKKKKKKQTKQKEYIDLSLIDEVMKLIIERGIAK